jgi:hypothetical protein
MGERSDKDEREEREAEEAAAAEAGAIGGRAGDEDLPDDERAVIEGGGGEAEGFELAEEDLIEHASHGDDTNPIEDAGEPEEPHEPEVSGEPDHLESTETDEDANR